MKKTFLLLFVMLGVLIFTFSAQAVVTNCALNADVQLKGAPFFTNGWGGGLIVSKDIVVDGLFLPRGHQWDQGAVWWDSLDNRDRHIEIDLGGLCDIESFIVQADDNDAYELFYWDRTADAWALAWAVPNYNVYGWGMQTRPNPADDTERYVLPAPIMTDALLFRGNQADGDKLFAVSEVQAFGERIAEVQIDIKPGSDPNCFNNNGHGVIPVALLGSADFDVAEIDASTVMLEGLAVKTAGKKEKLLAHYEDVNADGYMDLVVQIEDDGIVFAEGVTTATVTGELLDGTPIIGTDSICMVP